MTLPISCSQVSLYHVTHWHCSLLCSHRHSFTKFQGLWQRGICAIPNRLSLARKSARDTCISVSYSPYRCSSGLYKRQNTFWVARLPECDVHCRIIRTFGNVLLNYTASHTRNRILHGHRLENLKSNSVYFTNTTSNHYMFVPVGHHHLIQIH